MAEVVLGLGMSHSPQMSMGSQHWAAYAANDARFPLIWKRKTWDFDDLVAARSGEGLAEQVNDEVWASKYERITSGIDRLIAALTAAEVDVVVIVGDDHHEIFTEDSMPTFAVYWGDTIEAIPPAEIWPTVAPAAWALHGDAPETYQCDSALGEHLITDMNRQGFDVAQVKAQREGMSAGHPYIAVRQRLMDRTVPPPMPFVPIMLNTYFPPNTPSPQRSWAFGVALGAAIESYPSEQRVAIVASGGLSHFVIDEDIDRELFRALESRDIDAINSLDHADYVSGTSESLCWLVVGGACTQLQFEVVEYVPGYRTAAGTGTALTAGIWE
jgi:3-O-methylgallate 3,4-dioxygenase